MAIAMEQKRALALLGGAMAVIIAALVAVRLYSSGGAPRPPVVPQNPSNGPKFIDNPIPTWPEIRLRAADMTLTTPLEIVPEPDAAGGKAIWAPANHPDGYQLKQKGFHEHLHRHYPESFENLGTAALALYSEVKQAEVEGRFGFKEGTAVREFDVKDAGNYRLYMRVRWCCACGNSFWFVVDNGPLMDFTAGGGAYGQWNWGYHREEGRAWTVPLAAGKHTLKVAYHEDGARLDQVLFTTRADDNWQPGAE
jgi:hypothetical protein